MSLPDWERNGWLQSHKSSPNEVRDLLAVVDRDLADSAAEGLSADWRMNMYNAALQAATLALATAGYRASRDQHHYRIIQSLREMSCTHGPYQDATRDSVPRATKTSCASAFRASA